MSDAVIKIDSNSFPVVVMGAPGVAGPMGATGTMVANGLTFVTPQQFGAVADDPGTGAFGTDDYPAFAAAIAYIESLAIAGYINGTIYRGAPTLYIPAGGYYCSQSLAPLFTGKIMGEGGKGWGAATRIRFPAGVDGLQLQAHNTSGKTTLDGVQHYAGDRLYISDIAFLGAYSGTESDAHGIRGKRAGTIERCTFDNFEGDGLYCNTTFNSGVGATEGNTNSMMVHDCDFQNCRRGRYCEGADANAIFFSGCDYINNRQWGAEENSFLGSHEIGPHIDGNARTADNTGTAAKPASYCYSSGHAYFCINGQEAWCAANAPSGTTADNTGWGYAWDQGAASPDSGVPAWAAAMTWRAGGPILHNGASNSSTFNGVHIEGNGVSQVDQGCLISGTLYEVVRVSSGDLTRNRVSSIKATVNGTEFGGNVAINGDLKAWSPSNVLGPAIGATVQDGSTILASRSAGHTISYKIYDSTGNPTSTPLTVAFGTGFGRSTDFTSGAHFERWKFGGNERFKIDNSGATITGGSLYVDANKVVGAQQAAIANHASDATVNAILAALRTHGLIAT